ncbi:MAG: hypothetical protein N3A66_00090 [Planctomycetota bacterium]|nr:hypothetical protein [Planctomycetota bacterium]
MKKAFALSRLRLSRIPAQWGQRRWVSLLALLCCAAPAAAAARLSESKRQFEGAERTIVALENDRIQVEVVPECAGRIVRFADKRTESTPFEWLDDCPYGYGARWEGKPFTHEVIAKGPESAAVKVKGGGKIAVAMLRGYGIDVANALDLTVERTMTIDAETSRLRIDVKIVNTGEGVAPKFRYMVHAVYGGGIPALPDGNRVFAFLPVAGKIEFFDSARCYRDMAESAGAGGAPLDHPFSRFTPGVKADKPRYEPGGWAAILTSAGPTYIYYDPKEYDFFQYWHGGDAEWHYTFEPHTKPVDLKPGEAISCTFTLAYDAKDVPFGGRTVAIENPQVPSEATAGSAIPIRARATTVRDMPEKAVLAIAIKDPQGNTVFERSLEGEVQPFRFTPLALDFPLPDGAALGKYAWTANDADGKPLASGSFEVVTPEEMARRKTERATAELKAQFEAKIKDLSARLDALQRNERYWREGVNLALSLSDPAVWPVAEVPAEAVAMHFRPAAVPVLGEWRKQEMARIVSLAPAPLAPWPEEPAKYLAALGQDVAGLRDIAAAPGGGLAALLVDAGRKRAEVVCLRDQGIARRFGRWSDQPGEDDEALGAGARALAVDSDGNIWVATNAWGQTSVYRLNQDNQPYEESVRGEKGAVKKFSADGKLLAAVPLLDVPMDLALAVANGIPVLLAPYRNVSAYHGAQVREGVAVINIAEARKIAEIKIPTGSAAVDKEGRIWAADVAGHVACYGLKGGKLFDVPGSPAPAVPDAKLPASSPLPAIVRADAGGSIWILYTLKRRLMRLRSDGSAEGEPIAIPATAGNLYRLALTASGAWVVGDNGLTRHDGMVGNMGKEGW